MLAGCDLVYQLDRSSDAKPFLANPDGDADGDDNPNGVDLCPLIDDRNEVAATVDEDEDGVGNACDPRPGIPDCLVLFDDFATLSPMWKSIGPAPELGGRLSLPAEPEVVLYLDQPLDVRSLFIEGYLPGSGSDPRAVQLFLDHEFGLGITGRACSVQQDTPDDPTRVAGVDYVDGEATTSLSAIVGSYPVNAGHDIQLGWNFTRDTQGDCSVELFEQGVVQEQTVTTAPPAGQRIAIRTTNAGLDLGAIAGYGRICD